MTELEFKILLHKKLCELTDLLLYYYNPCKLEKDKCIKGNPSQLCCYGTRFRPHDNNPKCQFLGENGCLYPNLECRVFLCEMATKSSGGCTIALKKIEELAKLFGFEIE